MKKWICLLLLFPGLALAQLPRLHILTREAEAALQAHAARPDSLPRLTAARRTALPAPPRNHLVFQTDATAGLYYYSGQAWVNVATGRVPDAAGYCGSSPARRVRSVAGTYRAGRQDGPGPQASFTTPYGIVLDHGMLYVAEIESHVIRRVEVATGTVTTVAGCPSPKGSYCQGGYRDGVGRAAEFNTPCGVTADGRGNLYVADAKNHRIRRIVLATGAVSTLAGSGIPGAKDGPGLTAQFNEPHGVAADSAGNVYVADTDNALVRRIDGATGWVSTLAGAPDNPQGGYRDGPAAQAQFRSPAALALDRHGSLFVADRGNHRVRCITLATGRVSTLAAPPETGPPGTFRPAEPFSYCSGIVADGRGQVYVTSFHQVLCVSVATGKIEPLVESAITPAYSVPLKQEGPASQVWLGAPVGVAVADDGTVYLADYEANAVVAVLPGDTAAFYRLCQRVARLQPAALTVAGLRRPPRPDPLAPRGPARILAGVVPVRPGAPRLRGPFQEPMAVAVGPAGVVYVADRGSHCIYRVAPNGRVSTLAGSGQPGYANGLGRAARFNAPVGIAVGLDGTVYVADAGNHCIRQVSAAGRVRTLAGNGHPGRTNGVGALAQFRWPSAVAVGHDGSVYVADPGNNRICRIRPGGRVSTVVAPVLAEGEPTAAGWGMASYPSGLAIGPGDTLYLTNEAVHSAYKITPQGRVLLLAGLAREWGLDGNGPGTLFSYPRGIAVSRTGTVYVAEPGNHTIYRIMPGGWVTTLAGPRSRQRMPPDDMRDIPLNYPNGVAVAPNGTLYIADTGNRCIRIIR